MYEELREIDLDITGYGIVCSDGKVDQAKDNNDIMDEFTHVEDFDLSTEGEDAVDFIRGRHGFSGNVFLALRNFSSADPDIQGQIGRHLKGYHENHFYMPDEPESLLLLTGVEDPISKYDPTLSGRIKYMN